MNQYLAQSSSERFPPTQERKKHRDSQPDIMQRAKNLKTLSPKWDISIRFLTLGLR